MVNTTMVTQKIILLSCGTFNPPTIMHLRLFELARDYFNKLGTYNVIGGIISPVHDLYGKKDMVEGIHRLEMVKLATSSTSWIKASSWEVEGHEWTRTRNVLDFHQSQLDNYMSGSLLEKANWMPETLIRDEPVKLKLLCGADVLESFNIPNLWSNADMKCILNEYGLVVITREGNDCHKSIYSNDILWNSEGNISLVTEWMSNNISSTLIRRTLRRNQSVRYFVLDNVIHYIHHHQLYSNNGNEG